MLLPAAHHFATVPRDSFIWRATSAWGVPAATRWTSNSRPAGVKRALACDIEPPVLVGLVHHHTRTGGSPHHAATNLYAQNI